MLVVAWLAPLSDFLEGLIFEGLLVLEALLVIEGLLGEFDEYKFILKLRFGLLDTFADTSFGACDFGVIKPLGDRCSSRWYMSFDDNFQLPFDELLFDELDAARLEFE